MGSRREYNWNRNMVRRIFNNSLRTSQISKENAIIARDLVKKRRKKFANINMNNYKLNMETEYNMVHDLKLKDTYDQGDLIVTHSLVWNSTDFNVESKRLLDYFNFCSSHDIAIAHNSFFFVKKKKNS